MESTTDFKEGPVETTTSPFPLVRILVFLTIFCSILLTATLLVEMTWNHFWNNHGMPGWQIVPLFLSLTFVACMVLGRRLSNIWIRTTYQISAIWLGFLNFGVFASIFAWLVAGLAALFSFSINPKWLALTLFGSALLAGLYSLLNASRLRVTRVTTTLQNLPEAWRGRDIALVTDLHLGNVRGARFTRRVVALLQSLQPETVLIGGDLFDGVEANFDEMVAPWKNLTTPFGIYYVTGNHEEFTHRARFINAVKRAGIQVLNNEKVEIEGLQIVGIHDGETEEPELFRSLLQRAELDHSRASLLLAHQPSHLTIPAEAGISLQLSGHTHGGQLWPWNYLAARVHKEFVYGLHRFGELQVLTSSGAGTWGMPMRLGTRSEIVLIRLG